MVVVDRRRNEGKKIEAANSLSLFFPSLFCLHAKRTFSAEHRTSRDRVIACARMGWRRHGLPLLTRDEEADKAAVVADGRNRAVDAIVFFCCPKTQERLVFLS